MRWLVVIWLLVPLAAAAQMPDFTRLAREQSAAVVSIGIAYAMAPVLPDIPHDELLVEFDTPTSGSGILLTSDGYVMTNVHVVEDTFNEGVVVRLADGREFLGVVVGMDPETDVALLKVEATGLPHAKIGDPRKLQPGEWVATIGAPFGLERSVASGIVSNAARSIPAVAPMALIQTDVAMNPGHSGGPLFNLAGEVVGLNSLIFSYGGGSIGLSFAIPIDVALEITQTLRRHGKVVRGRIGVHLQDLTADLARALRLDTTAGALVTEVDPQGPAQRAGIAAGDVIVRFGGKAVSSYVELVNVTAATPQGEAVQVDLMRFGKPVRATVMVAASIPRTPRGEPREGTDALGFKLAVLSELQRRRLGVQGSLLVQRAQGAARRAGILSGDVILSVNGRSARSAEGFERAMEDADSGDVVALLVERAGSRAFVALRIP